MIYQSTSPHPSGNTTRTVQSGRDTITTTVCISPTGGTIATSTQTNEDAQQQAFAVLRHFGITEIPPVVVPLEVGQVWHSHLNPNLTRTITCVTDDMVAYNVDDGYGDVYPLIRTHEHLRTYSLPAPEKQQ